MPETRSLSLRDLLNRLDTYYDFECEGGPLRLCVDWQELRARLLDNADPPASDEDIESFLAAYHGFPGRAAMRTALESGRYPEMNYAFKVLASWVTLKGADAERSTPAEPQKETQLTREKFLTMAADCNRASDHFRAGTEIFNHLCRAAKVFKDAAYLFPSAPSTPTQQGQEDR